MKFSVLSGAIKNAGDYLIVERSIQLLKYVYPKCEIKIFNRNQPLIESVDEINNSDALIFAGGPVLAMDIYPKDMPLVPDLNQITTKMFTIGLGWYGKNNLDSTIYEDYKFSQETLRLVERMEQDGKISCRDWYTVRILKNQGFKNVVMTGCPAWYDLSAIHQVGLSEHICMPYKKICISDPGYSINVERSYELAKYLKEKFPKSNIYFVFHRGIAPDEKTAVKRGKMNLDLVEKLNMLNVKVHDISYSANGFSIYDDCDLHVGFRVHAHIYNISKRNISILLEEDGRGAGVNEALGLYGIKPYHYRNNNELNKVELEENAFYLQNLDAYLDILQDNNFTPLKQAYYAQSLYFEMMIKHIETLQK